MFRVAVASLLGIVGLGLFVVPRYGSFLPDKGVVLFGLLPEEPTAHVVITMAVALAWVWALPRAPIGKLLPVGLVLAGLAESVQALPQVHRTAQWGDLALNAVGVALGLAAGSLARAAAAKLRGLRSGGTTDA